jgi:ferredoxin/flavodoxin---NADP+ reductase
MTPSSDKHFRARILERRDISADLRVLRVEPGGPFKFIAGQYATLGVERDGRRFERAYSIASSPYEDFLEFFVELVPQGDVTPDLFKLGKGDTLLCRKIAKGRFTLDLRSGRTEHLLVSTVTGVAPFVSYVRTLYRDWKNGGSAHGAPDAHGEHKAQDTTSAHGAENMPGPHKLFCLHGASRSFEFAYREELEHIAAEAPWFKYVPTVSRPWEDSNWKGETGRVDDVLRKYADVWGLRPDTTTAYLCGHPSMIEHGRGMLERAGWKKDGMLDEVYFVQGKSSPPSAAEAVSS